MLHFFARRLNELHKVKREERGFTLIELLVVVIIIGILAAIAIPVFLAQRERAQIATCRSDMRNFAAAATSYQAENAPAHDFSGMTTAILAADHGFNQTTGYTSSVVGTPAADYTAQTVCAGGTGTVTFSSATGQISGP